MTYSKSFNNTTNYFLRKSENKNIYQQKINKNSEKVNSLESIVDEALDINLTPLKVIIDFLIYI